MSDHKHLYKIIMAGVLLTLLFVMIIFVGVRMSRGEWDPLFENHRLDAEEKEGFEYIENFNVLTTDQQKKIMSLIGEWTIVEWNVRTRGYDYNSDWTENDDDYIGRDITIRDDGTAIYLQKCYQVEKDEVSILGIDIALGNGYVVGDAKRLGEQMVLAFSHDEKGKAHFWIHIDEGGKVYYRDEMTAGLYLMEKKQ